MAVETSILKSVRKSIGPSATYDVFDEDLIMNINVALSRLCQLGVGPSTPFAITSDQETWDDLQVVIPGQISDIKQYLYLKTKLIFDPPANSSVAKIYEEQIATLEWTLKEVARYGY